MPDNKIFRPEDFEKQKHSEKTTGNGGTLKKVAVVVPVLLVVGGGCWYAFSISKDTGAPTDETASVVQTEQEKGLADSTASNVPTEEDTTTPVANDAEGTDAPQTAKSDAEHSTESSEPIANATNQEEPAVSLTGTLEQKANDVIRGIYGNGQERKEKLGNEYRTIQDKVNEMYRNGLVR